MHATRWQMFFTILVSEGEYVYHRSGVLLLAKTETVKLSSSIHWRTLIVYIEYLSIIFYHRDPTSRLGFFTSVCHLFSNILIILFSYALYWRASLIQNFTPCSEIQILVHSFKPQIFGLEFQKYFDIVLSNIKYLMLSFCRRW